MFPDPLGPESPADSPFLNDPPSLAARVKHALIGGPRDLGDRSIFHRLSLIPFLAWVGLGADGLSSSAYGPEEAFVTLGEHRCLAVLLAIMTATTVLIIAAAYSRIIEQFPHGGGGYVVATKLLGERVGVISGSSLLVDYVLTITVSIAAAGDALFSFVPLEPWHGLGLHAFKVPLEVVFILGLTTLNIRGVRESVLVLTPVFIVFLITHIVLIAGGIGLHVTDMPAAASRISEGFGHGFSALGAAGMLLLLVHAYSLGGGTYTGIEAVSNGLTIMREPRVHTARRTMLYMSISLAFTAGGLLVCYLLAGVNKTPDRTLNYILATELAGNMPLGGVFVLVTILAEGSLLVVAAQAGFIDGPRVLANMATDSWFPRRFAALSDRLTTANGIVLMGIASLAALIYTHGDVRHLVVMYSINVFLTFSLSMFGMLRYWFNRRKDSLHWRRRTSLFAVGFLMCVTILTITVLEKFAGGGWVTVLVTGTVVVTAFMIRRHYRSVADRLVKVDQQLKKIGDLARPTGVPVPPLDPAKPTAIVLVQSFSGIGIHTVLQVHRAFGGHFRNYVFLSVGVIDSGGFKGADDIDALRASTEQCLRRYVELMHGLGYPAASRMAIGTEVVSEAEKLCLETAKEYAHAVFFTGQIIFRDEKWYHKPLHNQTAFAIQRRLQWLGKTMVIMPIRVS